MKRILALNVLIVLTIPTFTVFPPTEASSEQLDRPPRTVSAQQPLLDHSRRLRDLLGFPSDSDTLQDLTAGAGLTGLRRHGFLLTPVEAVEYQERQRVSALNGEPSAYASSLPGFAGVMSNFGGETFTYRFTGISDAERNTLRSLFPDASRLRIAYADHSLRDLEAELARLEEAIALEIEAGTIAAYGVDIEANALLLMIHHNSAFLSESIDLQSLVDVPVRVMYGDSDDNSCSSREFCDSPRRAGVRLQAIGGQACSSGYIVRTTTGNEMALTAGHCWWGSDFGNRYSGGFYGNLTTQNVYGPGSSADARLVETENATTNNWLYHSESNKGRVVGQRHLLPDTEFGDIVCLYAYPEQDLNCGSVEQLRMNAYSMTCECMLADQYFSFYESADINSGGAIGSQNGYTAIGIHGGRNGGFARWTHIYFALAGLNVTLSTSP